MTEAVRDDPNVAAFLWVIAACEGTAGPDGYRTLFGGSLFASYDDHPRVRFYERDDEFIRNGRKDYTTAAGRYQATATTWDEFVLQAGPHDFSPASQDSFAVWCIKRAGALDDVVAGRLEDALRKCSGTWASLPFATVGQPKRALAYCRLVYEQHGGTYAPATQPAAPIEDRSTNYTTEARMPFPLIPLIAAFGPALIQMIPQVAKLFANPEDTKKQRNIEAIQLVFDTIEKATGQPSVQAAIAAMQADPVVQSAARVAVVTEPTIMAVLEIGEGGIAKAREANAQAAVSPIPIYKNPAIVIAVLLMPLVYVVVFSVLFASDTATDATNFWRGFWGPGFMPETRSATVNLVLGMVLGGIMGFFFGTTVGSHRKTDIIAGHADVTKP